MELTKTFRYELIPEDMSAQEEFGLESIHQSSGSKSSEPNSSSASSPELESRNNKMSDPRGVTSTGISEKSSSV